MIKRFQLFELLYFLLTATTTTVVASFCTPGASTGRSFKIYPFSAGRRCERWQHSGHLHLHRTPLPENILDGFPSSQHQSLGRFAMKSPVDGLDTLRLFDQADNSGGLGEGPIAKSGVAYLSTWKDTGLIDYISDSPKVELVQYFEDTKASTGESAAEAMELLQGTVNNIPTYGRSMVGGVGAGVDDFKNAVKSITTSALDTVGAGVDDLKASVVLSAAATREALKLSSAETFDSFKETTASTLEAAKTSTAAALDTSREAMLITKKEMIDKVLEIYTSETVQTQQANLIGVGQRYSTVLETKYHLSQLPENIMSGEPMKKCMDYVSDRCQAFLDALDLKNNAPFILLVVTIFWASIARRDGIEYGKLQAQGTIETLQDKLESTKAAAKTETDLTAAELKDLRNQLNALKSQVEILAVAARDVTEQLSQEKADSSMVEGAPEATPALVENVTSNEAATISSLPLEDIVEAPKKATPKKYLPQAEVTERPASEISTLSSHSNVSFEPDQAEAVEGFKVTAEKEIPPLTVAAQKKSVPKKRATSAKIGKVEQQVTEIIAPSPAAAVNMKPEDNIVGAALKEAKAALSISGVRNANGTLASGSAMNVKAVGKTTSPSKKKTIALKGTSRVEKFVKSEALQDTLEETKKSATTSPSVASEWGNLSESTLKRKTVKELIEYLESKGVVVTGADGKKPTKDTLVNLVISS